MTYQIRLAMLIPLLAVVTIVVFAGGLGILFMIIESAFHEWGLIGFGIALTVGVPAAAALLQKRVESQ